MYTVTKYSALGLFMYARDGVLFPKNEYEFHILGT